MVDILGTHITAQNRENHKITKNVSHCKKYQSEVYNRCYSDSDYEISDAKPFQDESPNNQCERLTRKARHYGVSGPLSLIT